MAERVRGLVAREQGARVILETILVPDPGPGAAKVMVQACGVYRTDLHCREGAIKTRVLTGHGEDTSVGAEAADYDAWVARGH